jgi:hypothetical protein
MDLNLDIVIDLLFGAIHYRLLFRIGRPDQALTDALVDAALRGIGPPRQATRGMAARPRR